MSIASIGSAASAPAHSSKLAPDGDTAAQEALESSATKRAEQNNGGFAPKAAAPAATSKTPGGVNTLA